MNHIDALALYKETSEFNQKYNDIKNKLNNIVLNSNEVDQTDTYYIKLMAFLLLDINERLKEMKYRQDLLLHIMTT